MSINALPLRLALAAAVVTAGLLAWGPDAAATAPAQDASVQATELHLDQGRRWQTDESLRAGMERIRTALVTVAQEPGDASVDALSREVDAAIAAIEENCTLPAAAHANLAVLLARLEAASSALKQGEGTGAAWARMEAAMAMYLRYFEHPGWNAAQA